MTRKSVFAVTYVLLVFLISRIVDVAIMSYELTSFSLLPIRVVLDPAALSARQMKSVLQARGISSSGLVDKTELQAVVRDSGDVTAEELLVTSEDDDTHVKTTKLTSESHFFEVVEDTKDSAWIVLVLPLVSGLVAMNQVLEEWEDVARKASQFGIRSARFDCSLDPAFCEARSWTSVRLLLAVPSKNSF